MASGLTCSKCGSNDIIIPEDVTDETVIICSCGQKLGTWGELVAITDHAKKRIQEIFGQAFKGEDGITFEPSND